MQTADFTVMVAGVLFGIRSSHESTRTFFKDYMLEGEDPAGLPLLEASPGDLSKAGEAYTRHLAREGRPLPETVRDPFLEQTVLHEKMSLALLQRDIFLMHGSALSLDGKGYLFTAPSGTGKSTHARLWREAFGDRAVMINDDKPYIIWKREKETFTLTGSPWMGKHRLGSKREAPLKGICILHQAAENRIRRLDAEQAMVPVLAQVYRPAGREDMRRTLAFIGSLLDRVPVYSMGADMSPEAAEVSRKAMDRDIS